MPSSTSSFKRRLRLPRLFFTEPSAEESIHGGPPLEFLRPIPHRPWRGITVVVVLLVLAAAGAWEFYCRSLGYGPTLDDNEDLWALRRRQVRPESLVIIGDSRAWFDLDLDELQSGLGKRPVQLGPPGTCAFPILRDLANDQSFHGTLICSIVPYLFFAPPGTFPMNRGEKVVNRFHHQTLAQRASQYLAMPLEEHIAFLNADDLTLASYLNRLPIADRPGALVPPAFPPYFCTTDRERRARMIEKCADPNGELAKRIQQIWIGLFTPPPPPTYIPKDVFMAEMGKAIGARFADTIADIEKLRARGGKIVFVRFPVSGKLREIENQVIPRSQIWDPLVQRSQVPGIHFEDFPELSTFTCPEWSHLSAGDSVEFTKRLVPHLRTALKM